ncbi:MAG: hypothetical protein J6D53_14335 [Blautia sp.]|nr:hypothetical protein [Blautia sp.]
MDTTIYALFQNSVESSGDKTAIIDPVSGKQITYKELDEYASRVAAKIKDAGVKKR